MASPEPKKGKSPVLIIMIIVSVLCIAGAIIVSLAIRGVIPLALPGEPASVQDMAWRIANFSILVIILHITLTNKIATFLSDRRTAIRDALDEAAKTKEDSQKRYEEVERMIKRAKQEIEEIYDSFATEGQRERDRLIKNAELEAEKIKKQAEYIAAQEIRKAKFVLRAEAVDIAVAMAEDLLKKTITKQDQERINKEFIKKASELK